jgi:hypothetical protein
MSVIRHDVARLKQDVTKKLILLLGEVPLFLAHFPQILVKKLHRERVLTPARNQFGRVTTRITQPKKASSRLKLEEPGSLASDCLFKSRIATPETVPGQSAAASF